MATKIGDVLAGMQARGRAQPAPEAPALPHYRVSNGTPGRADCPDCKGTGFFRVNVPIGHFYFGKLLECDCAAETRTANETARLQAASALTPEDMALTWASINDNGAVHGAVSS